MIQPESDPFDNPKLQQLRLRETGYYFKAARYGRALGAVSIAGLHGPFGVGTTKITNEVHRLHDDMEPIPTITTRHRRPEDPVTHRTAEDGITFDYILERAEQESLLNFHVNAEGHVYGTTPESIPAGQRYLVGPISFSSIETLQFAGLASYDAVIITREGESYRRHLQNALKRDVDAKARFIESEHLLAFASENLGEPWLSVVELSDDPMQFSAAADDIARIARQGTGPLIDDDRQHKLLSQMWRVLQEIKRDTLQ